jgi:hypothetical protein
MSSSTWEAMKASIQRCVASSWGSEGLVAVEPQVALRGIIEINCRLNDLVQRYVNTTGLCRPGEASEREQGRG